MLNLKASCKDKSRHAGGAFVAVKPDFTALKCNLATQNKPLMTCTNLKPFMHVPVVDTLHATASLTTKTYLHTEERS